MTRRFYGVSRSKFIVEPCLKPAPITVLMTHQEQSTSELYQLNRQYAWQTGEPLLSKEGRLCRSSECNVTLESAQTGWSSRFCYRRHHPGRAEITASVASLFGAATPPLERRSVQIVKGRSVGVRTTPLFLKEGSLAKRVGVVLK